MKNANLNEKKSATTIIDDLVEAGQALLDSIDLGVLKLWNVRVDPSSKKVVAVEVTDAGKATSIHLMTVGKKTSIGIEFQYMSFTYEPCKLRTSGVRGSRVGLFFSKEDAELALKKELKKEFEEDLAERIKAVNELKAEIGKLDSEIAKDESL